MSNNNSAVIHYGQRNGNNAPLKLHVYVRKVDGYEFSAPSGGTTRMKYPSGRAIVGCDID